MYDPSHKKTRPTLKLKYGRNDILLFVAKTSSSSDVRHCGGATILQFQLEFTVRPFYSPGLEFIQEFKAESYANPYFLNNDLKHSEFS